MKFTEAVKREAGEQQDMIGDDKADWNVDPL